MEGGAGGAPRGNARTRQCPYGFVLIWPWTLVRTSIVVLRFRDASFCYRRRANQIDAIKQWSFGV